MKISPDVQWDCGRPQEGAVWSQGAGAWGSPGGRYSWARSCSGGGFRATNQLTTPRTPNSSAWPPSAVSAPQ